MKKSVKSLTGIIIVLFLIVLAFGLGRWTGYLRYSLEREANYPWELHKKMGSVDITCMQFLTMANSGRFLIQTIDEGSILIVATYDSITHSVHAIALSDSGEIASDDWPLDCK